MPTPDVASVTDPAGVVGSLEGSGGQIAVTGTVIFPQVAPAVTDGSSVDVAEESCSLPDLHPVPDGALRLRCPRVPGTRLGFVRTVPIEPASQPGSRGPGLSAPRPVGRGDRKPEVTARIGHCFHRSATG